MTCEKQTSLQRDVLLPILTGVVAIVLERRLYNSSATVRRLSGAQPPV